MIRQFPAVPHGATTYGAVTIVMDDNDNERERRQTNQNRSVTGAVIGDADNVV
jgi:hypothetical protein